MTPLRTSGCRVGRPAAAALVLALALGPLLAGCSGGNGSSSDSANPRSAAVAPMNRDAAAGTDSAVSAYSVGRSAPEVQSRALISTGTVSLSARDVADARFDVQKVVDRFGGEISDERSDTGDDGKLSRVHLVVRVPAADFTRAMDALTGVGHLEYSSSKSRDVTTQVIDVQSRLRVQRRSVNRITELLDRAQNLRDIVLIEGQLTRRQATLDSLERQSAYLADQTSLSTVTVDIERTPAHRTQRHEDHTGFLAGLGAGWHGLTAVTVALATALGALLPFAVVALALALLGWPLLRPLRRRHTPPDEPVASPGG